MMELRIHLWLGYLQTDHRRLIYLLLLLLTAILCHGCHLGGHPEDDLKSIFRL